ncbi:DUF721 domain-containing protein [Pleurocapsa sp. PCC 7319]|uniref:DUF721 domain-containing protein n=1 Tax=Pleurocapsa sp. PCC 7319 TaxID=118161 RepID=UPI00034ADB56|nr:DciA family protein [Pleurocapsa sp. PCC 7319]
MFFQSLDQILTKLEQQPEWEKYREYHQLLTCWYQTVSPNIAENTRPLYISRQVLWVATSSAARAQELSFQRYTLLKKLNHQLPYILKDIRFSSSQWHQKTQPENTKPTLFNVSNKQKSKINHRDSRVLDHQIKNEKDKSTQISSSSTKAGAAAERWLKTIKQNPPSFQCCPNCDSPTPKGEIERWNLCYLCVAQKWSQEYRPPTFPEH